MDIEQGAAALDDATWMNSIRQRLDRQAHLHTHPVTIYKVPQTIRNVAKDAYEPKVISIGPYHRGKQNLSLLEKHKWRYLHDFLTSCPDISLEKCLTEMRLLEEKARSFYSDTFELTSDEFAEMMLLDGCFIVEFLKKLKQSSLDFIFTSKEIEEPIFNTMWMLPPVVHDILLLENQLPFFIPQCLFDLSIKETLNSLMDLAFVMFNCLVPLNGDITPMPTISVHHLLHLFHTHILPSPQYMNTNPYEYPHYNSIHLHSIFNTRFLSKSPTRRGQTISPPASFERKAKTIPSVAELQDAGIRFKKKANKVGSFMEIEFSNGVMEIPELYIYPNTTSVFRNLIAFEQCCPKSKTHFTAYAMFMDSFINSPRDIMLLKQQGIIQHGLGTDKEVVLLFNQIGKGVNFYYSKTYLWKVYKDVKSYYETDWHKWRATLMHDYFGNPWTFLSLAATLMLLLLTILQTVLAVLSHISQ